MLTLQCRAVEIYFAEPKGLEDQAQLAIEQLKKTTESLLQQPVYRLTLTKARSLGVKTPIDQSSVESDTPKLIVAIGPAAYAELFEVQSDIPLLAVLLSKASYHGVLDTRGAADAQRLHSGIFSNPDPLKQLALAKVLYGNQASAALIHSPQTDLYLPRYRQVAQQLGVELLVVPWYQINSVADLVKATQGVKALFLLKDANVFQRLSLERILLSSYDINRQGILGYSKGLVANGAAATTYASIENIAESISLAVQLLASKQQLPAPGYTQAFEVVLNKYLLRSLNLVEMSESQVKKEIVELIYKDIN